MAEEIIKARVWTKVDTLENWNNNPLLLGPGEMALVTTPSGIPLNMKWGDKNERKRFSDLPFAISYDQGQFVAIDGPGALPTPESEVAYSLVGPGTYTYPGRDDIVVEEGHWGQVVYNDGEWSFIDMGDLPQPEIDSTDVILGESSLLTTETAVYNYSTPLFSPRILPTGYEFIDIDRPDLELDPLTIVDEEMNIIPWDGDYTPIGDIFVDLSYDRPDLGLTFIDKDGYIIYSTSTSEGDIDENEVKSIVDSEMAKSEYIAWYTEFGEQESYEVNPGLSLEDFYGEWDAIMDGKTNNPSYPNYITKTLLGKSTMNDQDIWRYDFTPPKPKVKVVLVGCTHGFEKNPTYMLRRFFSYFVDNWASHSMLQWARWNVQFIVVPVLNAGGYLPSTWPGGSSRGVRYVLETEPFPATWTKSGGTITLSFDPTNFPDTGGRLDGSEYFSHPGVAGKTFVSIIDSSSSTGLPVNAYRIATVISGTSITFEVPAGGAASGTCNIVVATDPNRQYATMFPTWEDYNSNSNLIAGPPPYMQDNKGTRPFSINESIYMRDLLASEDDGTLALLIDFHSGSGDYVTYYNNASGMDISPARMAQEMVADFHTSPYNLQSVGYNMLAAYASQEHGAAGYTPEWGWYENMDTHNATDQHRWFANLILILSRYYSK